MARRSAEKYTLRLKELIDQGNQFPEQIRKEIEYQVYVVDGEAAYLEALGLADTPMPWERQFTSEFDKRLIKWAANCKTILTTILPLGQHGHIDLFELLDTISHTSTEIIEKVEIATAKLEAILDDLENHIFADLRFEIESEISIDYLDQAEQLLKDSHNVEISYVPAAVLAGAVLEKNLRTLCSSQAPPLPLSDGKGNPLMMNRLIDDLKKAGAFNELTAKQLRAWADIRNKAAHGEFDQFTHRDVETMIGGINNFLANYQQ